MRLAQGQLRNFSFLQILNAHRSPGRVTRYEDLTANCSPQLILSRPEIKPEERFIVECTQFPEHRTVNATELPCTSCLEEAG